MEIIQPRLQRYEETCICKNCRAVLRVEESDLVITNGMWPVVHWWCIECNWWNIVENCPDYIIERLKIDERWERKYSEYKKSKGI